MPFCVAGFCRAGVCISTEEFTAASDTCAGAETAHDTFDWDADVQPLMLDMGEAAGALLGLALLSIGGAADLLPEFCEGLKCPSLR